MEDRPVLIAAVLEEACLTVEQLSGACAVSTEWVATHVLEGRLHAPGDQPSQWRFSSRDVARVRTLRRLEIAFEADPELAALVADLVEELADLRAQLRRIAAG